MEALTYLTRPQTLALLAVVVTAIGATEAHSQAATVHGPIYYDISSDPESPSLLHLDEIQDDGDDRILLKTDLFNLRPKAGLETLWRFDCAARTMKTIAAARLTTPVPNNEFTPIDIDDVLTPESSTPAKVMFDLVCKGEGRLDPQRVFEGDYQQVLEDFWAR